MKRLRPYALLAVVLLCACSVVTPLPYDVASAAAPGDSTEIGVGSVNPPGDTSAVTMPSLNPDLAPYATALRPTYARDIETFGDATRYDVELTIAPDLRHVQGMQRTRYTNRGSDDLPKLLLRLYPNTPYLGGEMRVLSATVDGVVVAVSPYLRATAAVSSATVATGTATADPSVVSLVLPEPLRPGQSAVFTVTYAITAPLRPSAGYRSFGLDDDILSLPNGYAMVPLRDASGWRVDTAPTYGDIVFAEMGLYRVLIHAPATLGIAATGVCSEQSQAARSQATPALMPTLSPSGRVARRPVAPVAMKDVLCVAAPVRDFAIHASNSYQVYTTTVASQGGPILISSFYQPAHRAGAKRALDYGAAAVATYERRFGPYPYKELKILETPTNVGGMEYPMLACVTNALYTLEGGYFEWIVAHEVAHAWWYGLVGSDPINTAWLDESLAQYSASLYIEDRYGADAARADRTTYFDTRYKKEYDNGRDAPVDQPTAAFGRADYSPLVYGKGPLFYEATRQEVGDRPFGAWLRVYFQHYRYRIAGTQALLGVADEVGIGPAVRRNYDEWLRSARRP
jgi:hypothetical protein